MDIIVIYSDLVGSTKTVHELNSLQVRRYYRIFLNEMTNVINDLGGSVLKFVGDCIIGFYILPDTGWIPFIDRAITCVTLMQKVMKESINSVATSEGLPEMSSRISIDYGRAQVLKVGVEGIYTTIDFFGDVMNITSKICNFAEPSEILLGENIWKLIYTDYIIRCDKKSSMMIKNSEYDIYSFKY